MSRAVDRYVPASAAPTCDITRGYVVPSLSPQPRPGATRRSHSTIQPLDVRDSRFTSLPPHYYTHAPCACACTPSHRPQTLKSEVQEQSTRAKHKSKAQEQSTRASWASDPIEEDPPETPPKRPPAVTATAAIATRSHSHRRHRHPQSRPPPPQQSPHQLPIQCMHAHVCVYVWVLRRGGR